MKLTNPTPELYLHEKFHYFFSGHKYTCNTERCMMFDDVHRVPKSPLEMTQKEKRDESTWRNIYEFIYKADERRYYFIMSQLQRLLENQDQTDKRKLNKVISIGKSSKGQHLKDESKENHQELHEVDSQFSSWDSNDDLCVTFDEVSPRVPFPIHKRTKSAHPASKTLQKESHAESSMKMIA